MEVKDSAKVVMRAKFEVGYSPNTHMGGVACGVSCTKEHGRSDRLETLRKSACRGRSRGRGRDRSRARGKE